MADTLCRHDEIGEEEDRANALVIAAAPDMLAALAILRELLLLIPRESFPPELRGTIAESMQDAGLALAKAGVLRTPVQEVDRE